MQTLFGSKYGNLWTKTIIPFGLLCDCEFRGYTACARRCQSYRLTGWWTRKNNWKNGVLKRRRGTRGY
jgi:hypothetical protein